MCAQALHGFETMENQIETDKFIPEKAKQIALARLDLVHKMARVSQKIEYQNQADYDFVKLHNTTDSHLRQVLGKSLQRFTPPLECYA